MNHTIAGEGGRGCGIHVSIHLAITCLPGAAAQGVICPPGGTPHIIGILKPAPTGDGHIRGCDDHMVPILMLTDVR
jgi:hypothetical protein